MSYQLLRRDFLRLGAGVCALSLNGPVWLGQQAFSTPLLISPGCWKSKVRIAKIYMGTPKAHWPTPLMDLTSEMQRYEEEINGMQDGFSDVEFVASELVTSLEQAEQLKEKVDGVDGILIIHLSMGILPLIKPILSAGYPTVLFSAPYSGHEWIHFGELEKEAKGQLVVILSSDLRKLADGINPIRAIHHLREAKILNLTTNPMDNSFLEKARTVFGTEIVPVSLDRILSLYHTIPDSEARSETDKWIIKAMEVVEPSQEEIYRSCKLALAFERLLEEEQATVITADCYGSMHHKLPAYPCIGFTRLNDIGLGGICESDLESALTFILFQGLCGRPGFISDPTVDGDTIILAHCLGTRKMEGPNKPGAPYKLRSIMERQEGAVPQIFMKAGNSVTQARIVGVEKILCFTGQIIAAPDNDRGCRTKITVRVDGDVESLWKNWSHGLHRVTCLGNIRKGIERFCGFKNLEFIDEARPV
ncbi:MAG: hypothetical protein AMXMBFR75_20370 [Candidatus Hinthialibacteria bacterium]